MSKLRHSRLGSVPQIIQLWRSGVGIEAHAVQLQSLGPSQFTVHIRKVSVSFHRYMKSWALVNGIPSSLSSCIFLMKRKNGWFHPRIFHLTTLLTLHIRSISFLANSYHLEVVVVVNIFPAIVYNFASPFSTAMTPISVCCLTTLSAIYGIVRMGLSFRGAIGRINMRSEYMVQSEQLRSSCSNLGVTSLYLSLG